MAPILEVRGVSKRFRLDRCTKQTLRRYVRSFLQGNASPKFHWALRDIHFTVQKGETVGIVGPNGAGESTLLKIIGGILEPTTGSVHVEDSLASLIELEACFYSDLDLKQNLYDRKLRSYSTGMVQRVALALANELQSHVIVIDDSFDRRDLRFQDKYLGSLEKLKSQGKTLLLASHRLDFVARICERGLYLREGRQILAGDIASVIEAYKKAPRATLRET